MDNTPLERLKRKLYEGSSTFDERPKGELRLTKASKVINEWSEVKKKSFFRRNVWFIIIGLFILGSAGVFIYFGLTSFSEDKVALRIEGTNTVGGAGIASWRVVVENNNRVTLKNATLVFVYPQNVLPIDDRFVAKLRSEIPLGVIGTKERADRVFKARVLGNDKEAKQAQASLTYQLKGISRVLTKEARFETIIQQSPFALTVDAPKEVSSGGEINWTITYQNSSDFDFSNLRLRVEYPDGFTFLSASTPPRQEFEEWGPLVVKAGQENTIAIRGTLKGDADEKKVFTTSLELIKEGEAPILLGEAAATITIIRIPLNILLSVDGTKDDEIARAGERLRYTLAYQNNFTQPIDNVVVAATLVGEMFDKGTIQSNGEVSFDTGRIQWDRNNVTAFRQLYTGESGELWVEVMLKNSFPINTFSDKNFTIQLVASITSDTPPITLTTQEITQQADIVLPISTQVGFKRIGRILGRSFGPMPPQIGQKTAYELTWHVSNSANDLQNVTIKAPLPQWAAFEGAQKINFAADGFTYDDATRTILWNIDRIPATTGIILPTYEAIFRLSVTPRQEDVGQVIDILEESTFVGRDAFTQESLTSTAPTLKTDLDGYFSLPRAVVSPST